MKRIVLVLLLLGVNLSYSVAQCAMCRAAVETNANNGTDTGFASALNAGILYLFVAPYLAIMVIGFLWYKKSKNNAQKSLKSRSYTKS
ncbi:hypothetical protein QWY31_06650 [Cytophagales bacterium LB-30]|uniref:Uncharacterized protein n=1 Tax=Shiella aurantiaca TaxID=3058365 RepID=A0ABT8F3Y5_9BACT|nr:hypothetical protein [Shiella aurantiaca]MDN4165172.1 hypothetical protein [Shiella aurantiaca]